MRFSHFCVDNEGLDFVPLKALVYVEPSLDGGPTGNSLHLAGVLYSGSMIKNRAVVELADAPGSARPAATSKLLVDGMDLWFPKKNLGTLVLTHSANWSGTVMAQGVWNEHFDKGLVQWTGPVRPAITALEESWSLPTQGAWTEGVERGADPRPPQSGHRRVEFQDLSLQPLGRLWLENAAAMGRSKLIVHGMESSRHTPCACYNGADLPMDVS